MNQHPNATVAGGTGLIAIGITWVLGYFHVALSAEAGAALATVLASIVLFIGRNGVKGTWKRILYGDPPPPDPPK